MAAESKTWYEHEKESPYRPPPGYWASAKLFIKDAFPEETTGVGDTENWIEIEREAELTRKEVCFQFNMRGIGHVGLAKLLIKNSPAARHENISKDEKEVLVNKLAHTIYPHYPPEYRKKFKR